MKQKNISLLVILLLLSTGVAQAQRISKSDESVQFRPHWNIQIMGGAGYTIGEANFGELFSPAATLNLGWQITPAFGLRLGGSGWQGKGHSLGNGIEGYSFNYVQASLDAVLDLGNLFAGYKHNRVVTPYIFLGGGAAFCFNNGANNVKSVVPAEYFEYLWPKNLVSPVGRGGVGLNFRLSDIVSIVVEANANVLSDRFNSKKAGNPDFQFNALAGLKINLGKPYTRKVVQQPVEVVDNSAAEREAARLAAERAAAEKAAAEKAAAEEAARAAAAAAAAKAARDASMQQVNTFFQLDSYEITAEEVAKLNDYVQWLKENPAVNIAITGYADAQTGRHPYNLRLSKNRVNAVKDFLTAAGIAPERILSDYKGDTMQPFQVNEQNRVVVSLVK
jgi:outer membrane protein OmpA-like peptidoglycan-associated protein